MNFPQPRDLVGGTVVGVETPVHRQKPELPTRNERPRKVADGSDVGIVLEVNEGGDSE